MLAILTGACTGSDDSADGEWPCRSRTSDTMQTYEYDAHDNLTETVSIGGGFSYTSTLQWQGRNVVFAALVGHDSPDFDYTEQAELDSRDRMMRRTREAKGKYAGESSVETWTWEGDRKTSGRTEYASGLVAELTYEYAADGTVTRRDCTETGCDTIKYVASGTHPTRIEADYDTDGELDWFVDYEYDTNGYVLVSDTVSFNSGQELHDRTEYVRRPYGAPELRTITGQYSTTYTYEFCSEDAP